MGNLASIYKKQGKLEEAVMLGEQVLEKMKEIHGDNHPDTVRSMNNLGVTYWRQGNKSAALQEEVVHKSRQINGDNHPATLISMENLAAMYWDLGRIQEAATLQEQLDKLKGEKEG